MSGHVLKRNAQVVGLLIEFCLAFTYIEHASARGSASTHTAHKENPQYNEEEKRADIDEQIHKIVTLLIFIVNSGYFALLLFGRKELLEFVH